MENIKKIIRKGIHAFTENTLNQQFKINLLQAIPFWIASIITGIIAVFYTQTFALIEKLSLKVFHSNVLIMFIVSPVCFFLARWLVKTFAPYARGSGIPQVMASVELTNTPNRKSIKRLLSLRVILVKIVSSFLMAFGGGAVGKEGPIIHIAGSVFKKIYNILPSWWPKISQKNMIMTGAAAGLAAAFNTPLGGIVFAVEELTKMHLSYFRTAIFTAVIIAGLTVQSFLGTYLYLGFPDVKDVSSTIFFAIIMVAIISGLLGGGMGKLTWKIIQWRSKFKKEYYYILYLVGGSMVLISLAYFVNENVLGSGKSFMVNTLFTQNKYSAWYMPFLRIFGSVFSFTTGASGGIFAPALSCGASVGSTISTFFKFSPTATNVLILGGMAAFLTGITRAPFTSAILVLEMTDRNNLILYLMLSAIISNFVSLIVDKYSLYEYLKNQYAKEIIAEDEAKNKSESLIENT